MNDNDVSLEVYRLKLTHLIKRHGKDVEIDTPIVVQMSFTGGVSNNSNVYSLNDMLEQMTREILRRIDK